MSYNRVKSVAMRNSRREQQQPAGSGIAKFAPKKTQKTPEKWNSPSPARAIKKPSPIHGGSLSQPSSSTILPPQDLRPCSGGDENQLGKFSRNHSATSDQSEDEDAEYRLFGKDSSDPISEKKIADDVESKNSNSVKASPSGIPLRIKTPTPSSRLPSSRKPPSRSVKTKGNASPSPVGRATSKTPVKNDSKAALTGTTSTRVLEMQFQSKRKKLELVKKDVLEKQKSLIDIYQNLLVVQKKLEESGKSVTELEGFKVIDFTDPSKDVVKPSDGSKSNLPEDKTESKQKIDPEMVVRMKDTIKQIPISLLQVCKNLMDKRLNLIEILQNMTDSPSEGKLSTHIENLKNETSDLEKMLEDTFVQQEKRVSELVDKWQIMLQCGGDYSNFSDHIEQLQEKLKEKEVRLTEAMCEMQDLRKKNEEDAANAHTEFIALKEKIKVLENEQKQETERLQEHKDKSNMLEQKLKLLKSRSREVDQRQKDAETKYAELQKQHKQLLDQLKGNEQKWAKEREEMITKSKHDRQMLDKLTKDRSLFETRMKTLEEMTVEWESKYKNLEAASSEEIEKARKSMMEEVVNRETMEQKYNNIQDQLVQMEVQSKQAVDLVNMRNAFDPGDTGIKTEREAELYTELLATRVALKSAEDQIQNYNREKLRFIDSLQTFDDNVNGENLATAIVKSVEKVTELESKLAKSEETICSQKIEIASLKVDTENLKQRTSLITCNLDAPDGSGQESDLKKMLHEGRMKLEQSLKKTLEYERKIIKYEHEINKQSKQIMEMDNLLKVRDGLISMMKIKKDELQMENESLNKYANEIRDLLLQAKEEARNRTELVQELSTNLDSRGRICYQLEKKVKELEGSLVVTNEKRFKLQDTLGVMEKELQSTKDHITKLAPEIQSRNRFNSNRE